jgi:hypothetical protein
VAEPNQLHYIFMLDSHKICDLIGKLFLRWHLRIFPKQPCSHLAEFPVQNLTIIYTKNIGMFLNSICEATKSLWKTAPYQLFQMRLCQVFGHQKDYL